MLPAAAGAATRPGRRRSVSHTGFPSRPWDGGSCESPAGEWKENQERDLTGRGGRGGGDGKRRRRICETACLLSRRRPRVVTGVAVWPGPLLTTSHDRGSVGICSLICGPNPIRADPTCHSSLLGHVPAVAAHAPVCREVTCLLQVDIIHV